MNGLPLGSLVLPAGLVDTVAAIIEAGWEPTSRGKAVSFDVDEHGR